MRIVTRVALCALFLFVFPAAAQSGASANGDFQFALTGATGAIQFNARAQGSGAKGQMTFTGTSEISNEDVDGEGTAGTPLTGASMTVDLDCLRVNGNQAAMSGVITASSVAQLVGTRALLSVEDGGEGKNAARDKFSWGVYRASAMNWTPSDAEVPGDAGWAFTWIATDAERNDDAGVPTTRNTSVDCKSFPLGSYAFEELAHGAGNIQVRP